MNLVTALGGGGGGLAIGQYIPMSNSQGTLQTKNGQVFLAMGSILAAAAYPGAPSVTYGSGYNNCYFYNTNYGNGYGSASYKSFLRTDGGSNILNIGSAGTPYLYFSSDGGKTYPVSAYFGIAATIYDALWFAPASLWVIATSNGLYTITHAATSNPTLRQSGSFYSVATDGTKLIATQTVSSATLYTSTNATSWSTLASGLTASYFTCIRYLNGGWVMVGGTSATAAYNVYYGSAGTSWSAGTALSSSYGGVSDIVYAASKYWTVHAYGSNPQFTCNIGTLTSSGWASYYFGNSVVAIAWNGQFLIYAWPYTSGDARTAYTYDPTSGNVASIIVDSGQNGNQSGAVAAFPSGPNAGVVVLQGSNSLYYSLIGTYIDNVNGGNGGIANGHYWGNYYNSSALIWFMRIK